MVAIAYTQQGDTHTAGMAVEESLLEFVELFIPALAGWLVTAGTGGSMLSIGSAAGIAVMGQAKGVYTLCCNIMPA